MLGATTALWVALAIVACGSSAPATKPAQTSPGAAITATPSTPIDTSALQSTPTAIIPAPTTPIDTRNLEPTPTATIPTPTTLANPEVDARARKANTNFGFRLFAQLVNQGMGENIFISPLSVAIALAMTYNGAEGETREAMAKTMGIDEMSLEDVNDANAALRRSLSRIGPNVELTIANSLWAREGADFNTDFLERNRQFYEAEITSLDFDDPAAPAIINQWVTENTQGKIDKIIDEINPMTVMFLINAIYFNGKWTVEFDEANTQDRPFHLLGGSEKQHPMMSQSGEYQYMENDEFQAVSLPYGEGQVSMYIFLPHTGSSLTEFLGTLNASNWEEWLMRFQSREGDIVLPRFRTEYQASIKGPLKELGMGIAFDPDRANFEGMRQPPPGLYISEVKHKAFVEVNEEGTKAAAVTSVEFGVTSVKPEEPPGFSFVADRPFFYAIRDNGTASLLFMGTLMEPEG